MKKLERHIFFLLLTGVLFACVKEVNIAVPEHEPKIVVDGRIETDLPPFVLISNTKNIYDPTDANALLESYVSGAVVSVSDGNNTVVLDEICSDNLPPGTEEVFAAFFDISVEDLPNVDVCLYTTINPVIFGQIGKKYTLTIDYEEEEYVGVTELLPPVPLDTVYWKESKPDSDKGLSWATLSDPAGQYDAYFWEVRRINKNEEGEEKDLQFEPTFSPTFDDSFFDGLTFDFGYENPFSYAPDEPEDKRGFYPRGDTVIIKFSKIDRAAFKFLEAKYVQLQNNGSPFASPINLPSNISNGARGVWAGYSPSIDTLICND